MRCSHRHRRNIDCLTACTTCLVCFISTLNGRSKKRKKRSLLQLALVAGTQQNLSSLYYLDVYGCSISAARLPSAPTTRTPTSPWRRTPKRRPQTSPPRPTSPTPSSTSPPRTYLRPEVPLKLNFPSCTLINLRERCIDFKRMLV